MASTHPPGFLKLVNAAKAKIKQCRIEEVRKRQLAGQELVLIDTREDSEWSQGSIAGATHLGKGVIERDIEEAFPDKSQEIILYCGGGFRSALAAAALQDMGYTRVISMDGGFRAWKEAGYPLQKP